MKNKIVLMFVILVFASVSYAKIASNCNDTCNLSSLTDVLKRTYSDVAAEDIKYSNVLFKTTMPSGVGISENQTNDHTVTKFDYSGNSVRVTLKIDAREFDTLDSYVAHIIEQVKPYRAEVDLQAFNDPNNGCNGFSQGTVFKHEFCMSGNRFSETQTCMARADGSLRWVYDYVNLGATSECIGGT